MILMQHEPLHFNERAAVQYHRMDWKRCGFGLVNLFYTLILELYGRDIQ